MGLMARLENCCHDQNGTKKNGGKLMKRLMLGLMMAFAVTVDAATEEISITRDRVDQKADTTNKDRYIFVTNKVEKTGPVKGKIGNHYVRTTRVKHGSQYLQIFADGSVQTSELNLKEPCLVCYVLISAKSTGRKYVRGARLTSEKQWTSGAAHNPKENSKKRVEVPASQWRAYRGITAVNTTDYVGLGMDETLVCYRMELWQDGKLLDMKDTSKLSVLQRLGLDFDWYVLGKNKGKLFDSRLTYEAE